MLWVLTLMVVVTACTVPVDSTIVDTTGAPSPEWERGRPMEVARSEMPAAVIDAEIYVPGGLTGRFLGGFAGSPAVEVYDPLSDLWRSVADLPEPRHHAMAAVLDGLLYVLGGMEADSFEPTDSAWRFDPATNTWTEIAPLPEPRAAGAAVALESGIYVVGGVPDGSGVWRYQPGTESWAAVASLAEAREHTAAAVLDGQIWVAGGRWNGAMLSSVEVYDPASDNWSEGSPLQEARSGFALVALEGRLVALGGEVFNPTNALASVEALEGTWSYLPDLPIPLHGVPAAVVAGAVYVLGGSRRAGGIDNPGDVYRLRA